MTSASRRKDSASDFLRVLSRALKYSVRAAPGSVVLLTAMLLLLGAVPVAQAWIIKEVVDEVAAMLAGSGGSNHGLTFWVVAWVGLLIANTGVTSWLHVVQGNMIERLTAYSHMTLMQKASAIPDLVPFEQGTYYDDVQVVEREGGYRPMNLVMGLIENSRALVTLSGFLVLLSAQLAWYYSIAIVAASLPQVIASAKLQERSWRTFVSNSETARRMVYFSSVVMRSANAMELRIFQGLPSFLMDGYRDAAMQINRSMNLVRVRTAFWNSGLDVLVVVVHGAAFLAVVSRASTGLLTPGDVVFVAQALGQIHSQLLGLASGVGALHETLVYFDHLFRFLGRPPTMHVTSEPSQIPDLATASIEFDEVSFSYPDGRAALRQVSMVFQPGEIAALVGENGAGKTTVVKLLARLHDPTEGVIRVGGVDLREFDLVEWRAQLGVAFQDYCRYLLTAEENIGIGDTSRMGDRKAIERAAVRAGADPFIASLPQGYSTRIGKEFGGTELSAGQWQKIAIARAFLSDASLYILDEPTASLDPRSEGEVYERFAELCRGKTAVLITHRLGSVSAANQILVLKSGTLVENGTHKGLLSTGGEYAGLWEAQAKWYQEP